MGRKKQNNKKKGYTCEECKDTGKVSARKTVPTRKGGKTEIIVEIDCPRCKHNGRRIINGHIIH